MYFKQYLKNVLLVTILEKKENYGTDAQVVEFGFVRSVAVGTLLMVTWVTLLQDGLAFLKLFTLIKFNIGFFLLLSIQFSLYSSILYDSFVTSAVIKEAAMEM